MTPTFLSKNVEWNCNFQLQDETHLFIERDDREYERIFRLKVLDKIDLPADNKLLDFDFSLCVGLEYTGTEIVRDPLAWCATSLKSQQVLGIQLRDITEYGSIGPYIGIEGQPGRDKLKEQVLRGKEEEISRTSTHWPRVFNMTLKPMEQPAIGYCWSSIENGHLFTCEFDRGNTRYKVDPTQDDVYLEAYRYRVAETYNINFVKLTITLHTEKPLPSGAPSVL